MTFRIQFYIFRRTVIISNERHLHERKGRHDFLYCHVIVKHYTRYLSTQKRHQTKQQQALENAEMSSVYND